MIAFHTACGLVALVAGAVVVLMPKGTRRHRQAGWVYVISMALLCATSFFIFELFGGFGVFHVMALVSSVSVLGGMVAPLLLRGRVRGGWLDMHFQFMLWSYVGLVMATGSHFMTPLESLLARHTPWGAAGRFWAVAGACWGLPLIVGGVLIQTRGKAAGRRVRAALKEQRDPEAVSSE
jgi:uncharacterized membrane protein